MGKVKVFVVVSDLVNQNLPTASQRSDIRCWVHCLGSQSSSNEWVAQATKRSRLKDRKSDPVSLRFLFNLSNTTKRRVDLIILSYLCLEPPFRDTAKKCAAPSKIQKGRRKLRKPLEQQEELKFGCKGSAD